jgi:predicted DNA binding CopG/RHH family protein
MKFSYNGCVYRTENLSEVTKQLPEVKKAIEKAEKRQAELKALELPEKPIEQIKKAYKKQDED